MELAALLGLTLKLAECMLAVKYRSRAPDGTRWGGPMVVMEARLGVIGKPMGRLYALFALLMSFSMGAMAQSGALADTFFAAFSLPGPKRGWQRRRWRSLSCLAASAALQMFLLCWCR